MREIAVITVSRSDFGIYVPVLQAIGADPTLRLRLLVSGMHLSSEFGSTVGEIESAGFEVFQRIDSLVSSDTPAAVAKSIGLGVLGFAQVFAGYKPDIVVLLGDRFDMLPAALAAVPFRIPLAHLHGGEVTEGAIDEAFRHSISKMSHLHFVSSETYAQRLRQMGEEEWRIMVTGAPALDAIRLCEPMSQEEFLAYFGVDLRGPFLLVTYHPVTLEAEDTDRQLSNLLDALGDLALPCLFTYPNADTEWHTIVHRIQHFCKARPESHLIKNAGQRGYWSLMRFAAAIVGNSSSGIIESAAFKLPVVNIGSRQKGRVQSSNILNCGYGRGEIGKAIRNALTPEFKASLDCLVSPYGEGHAAERIVARLAEIPLTRDLMVKRFVDRKLGDQGELGEPARSVVGCKIVS